MSRSHVFQLAPRSYYPHRHTHTHIPAITTHQYRLCSKLLLPSNNGNNNKNGENHRIFAHTHTHTHIQITILNPGNLFQLWCCCYFKAWCPMAVVHAAQEKKEGESECAHARITALIRCCTFRKQHKQIEFWRIKICWDFILIVSIINVCPVFRAAELKVGENTKSAVRYCEHWQWKQSTPISFSSPIIYNKCNPLKCRILRKQSCERKRTVVYA